MKKKRMENKMQDSQKTKDELWNRLWKEFGQLVYMEGMNEHVKRGANGDLVDFIASEISKAREGFEDKLLDREREAQIEVLTDIFRTCYQEDSKTLELVEEKLSKLTTK